jgi:hypothetical protein
MATLNVDITQKPIRSAAILTTSYVAGTILDTSKCSQVSLLIQVTLGSLTSVQTKIETSSDGVTYFQETFQSIATTTSTDSLGEHSVTASGNYVINVPILSRYLRVSFKGTGTVTSSSVTADAILGIQ